MATEQQTVLLPDDLQRYFWDYDAGQLSRPANRHTIATRLLQSGGWGAVRWLREQTSDDELRQFLVARRGRRISPERLRFWGLILDLPRRQVDEWLSAGRSNPWHRRTHR